jgi:hypothetical protein
VTDSPRLVCSGEERRELVRRRVGRNGLDYVEVEGEDQKTLRVYFLGRAPERIEKENVRIEGGRRITGIRVTRIDVVTNEQDLDDYMDVTVDQAGDFSTYRLCVVEPGPGGRHTPREDFDPRYACVDFSFKADCATDLDCKPERVCPQPARANPEINYLARDYASFRQLILDRLALIMPDWRERHVPDVGIALVEVLAYVADHLSYYQDAVATEAYLDTARRRISVRRHARLVDYRMHEGCNARAWVWVRTSADTAEIRAGDLYFATVDENGVGSEPILRSDDSSRAGVEVFEPLIPHRDQKVKFLVAHNEIRFYTWGDRECCIPKGATRASLRDAWIASTPPTETPRRGEPPSERRPHGKLRLKPGDFLVLEETRSPITGLSEDADPLHRHVVCLTRVRLAEDRLVPWPGDPTEGARPTPVVEVEWDEADALPFALCVSAIGPAPECALIEDVSVARGNVVLVDHGRSFREPVGVVPLEEPTPCCEGEGSPSETAAVAGDFEPRLEKGPITFREPLLWSCPTAGLLDQDPRQAMPEVLLKSTLPSSAGAPSAISWKPIEDLLGTGPEDPVFVVEIDDEGIAHIRFGDGELGRQPEPSSQFEACYRIGNGSSGNVGANAIRYVGFYANPLSGISMQASNPFPAQGGAAPESNAEVKLLAPQAFRQRLERAITADDYARLAERDPRRVDRRNLDVHAAAASVRWTGAWNEVRVALDAAAKAARVGELPDQIAKRLERYRRLGHDVRVAPAREVPLYVKLCVVVRPHYLKGHVESALLDVLSNRELPDGRFGFFHPDRLTFGQGVSVSQLVAAAQAVTGVESVEVQALERQFEGSHGEVRAGVLPLGPMEVARLDNDPNNPESGKIVLIVTGGR